MIVAIPITLSWVGLSGSPGANVWHARTDAPAPGGDFDEQLEWIRDYYTAIAEAFHASVNIDFEGFMYGVADDEGTIVTADTWHVDGSGGGDALSPGLCILQKWRCATGGRSGKGRTYLGPLSEGLNDASGQPSSSARALISGAADDLIESSDTATNGALGVWSKTDGLFRDFIDQSVNSQFAFLRSRRD